MAAGESARTSGDVLQERYRLEEKIGRGGMGEVWRAEHTITSQQVALKFFVGQLEELDRIRLFREARTASKVRHPGIVAILDAFVDEAYGPVIVMELLEGETLAALLAHAGPLALEPGAALLLEVVEAVAAAHAEGIAHRDIKPTNIFMVATPAGRRVKVVDFGLAKGIEADEARPSAGMVFGTPAYMAPEQCRGDRNVDHRADAWALGVVIHEVLTGQRPIAGDSIGEVIENLLMYGVPSLRMTLPDAPLPLVIAVRRLLERNPEARAPDLREITAALEQVARRDPKPAIPDRSANDVPDDREHISSMSIAAPASSLGRRHLAAGALAVSVLAVAAVAAVRPSPMSLGERQPAARTWPSSASAVAPSASGARAVAASSRPTSAPVTPPRPAPRPAVSPAPTTAATLISPPAEAPETPWISEPP